MIDKNNINISLVLLILIIIISFIIKILSYKQTSQTFRIYYNKINNNILADMSNYDLNIVEASFFEISDVETIHQNNSKVIGYISLVEIGYWDDELIAYLEENDYLTDSNNKKIKSLDDKNYLGDLSSEHFQEILLKYIDKRILSKNMDGIFLDTLDWIDYYNSNIELQSKLLKGYKELLIKIKNRYPNIYIMQNRSLESYFSTSKNYISAILWENFDSPFINTEKKSIIKFMKLFLYAKLYKTNVYIISFSNEEINRKLVKKMNWNYIFSQMENRYSKWDIIVR
ncbi:MAG: putative glycoside hydrolase [Pleomorphochaeta sp.]